MELPEPKPKPICVSYFIKGRVVKLLPNKVRMYVKEFDNTPINQAIDFKFDPSVYGELIKHLKDFCFWEMREGMIVEFKNIAEGDELMIQNGQDILRLIVDSREIMKKAELFKEYKRLSNCSQRTAERHLAQAIEDGIIKQVDHHTIKARK